MQHAPPHHHHPHHPHGLITLPTAPFFLPGVFGGVCGACTLFAARVCVAFERRVLFATASYRNLLFSLSRSLWHRCPTYRLSSHLFRTMTQPRIAGAAARGASPPPPRSTTSTEARTGTAVATGRALATGPAASPHAGAATSPLAGAAGGGSGSVPPAGGVPPTSAFAIGRCSRRLLERSAAASGARRRASRPRPPVCRCSASRRRGCTVTTAHG